MSKGQNFDRRTFVGLSVAALGTLALGGCDNSENDGADTGAQDNGSAGASGDNKSLRIAWIPWDECIAVSNLWKVLLEDKGYEVELVQADAGPIYQSLDTGDVDLFLDSWLPITHEDYWGQYGDNIERIADWYTNAKLCWTVPTYMDIDSITDLKGMGAELDGRIVGIEPGAGITRLSKEEVLPGYDLESEFSLVEGSTTAMLAELDRATKAEDPIVVTLWRPHWAYNGYELKDLEDPEMHLGEAESCVALGRNGFGADFAEVNSWISNFKLDDNQLAELEDYVIVQYDTGQEEEAVRDWLSNDENQALVDSWMA